MPHSAESSHHGSGAGQSRFADAAHQIGTGLTLAYVLLSAVGVVFETLLLRAFDTNFLTYAEPEDFLMAGLRHPMLLAFVGLSVAIFGAVAWFVRLGSRLSNAYAAWRDRTGSYAAVQLLRRVTPYLAVAYYFFLFADFYASHTGKAIRAGEEPRVRVDFQFEGVNPAASGADPRGAVPAEGYLIATTGRYVFLWQPDSQQMQVIPVTAVRRLVNGGPRVGAPAHGQPPADAASK